MIGWESSHHSEYLSVIWVLCISITVADNWQLCHYTIFSLSLQCFLRTSVQAPKWPESAELPYRLQSCLLNYMTTDYRAASCSTLLSVQCTGQWHTTARLLQWINTGVILFALWKLWANAITQKIWSYLFIVIVSGQAAVLTWSPALSLPPLQSHNSRPESLWNRSPQL